MTSRPCIVAALMLAAFAIVPRASAQSDGTEFVTFWRGDLRIFATRPNTRVTLIDIATGGQLAPALWTGNFGTNPFTLRNVGDSFEGNSGYVTHRVRIVASTAGGPVEPKPVVAWTGCLAAGIQHPVAPPADQNAWASYIPDVARGVGGSVGGELGVEFLGFSSRDMYVFAEKSAPVSITVTDLGTNTDTDTDDSFVLDRTSPYLVHEDAEVEIYAYHLFEDDTIQVASNVPASILVGLISPGWPDWASTPPSYAPSDEGRELGTLFYTFAQRWLTIMPVLDDTTVTVTDLSDGDDTWTVRLPNGDRANPAYDMYVADPTGRAVTLYATPRLALPAVTFHAPPGGPLDDDFVRITSDRPVLVHVGPIASDTNEFSDVAYSVPTGPSSQLIMAYGQNGGANDFQIFSTSATNNIRITSLSYTFGTAGVDYSIPSPTPFGGGNAITNDWYWSTGACRAELFRIEADEAVQVMSGDFDTPNFGSFIPFVARIATAPPRADAGPDIASCPGEVVVLDGSSSFDRDAVAGGGTVTWTWDLDVSADSDGNTIPDDDVDATGASIAVPFAAGTHVGKLTFTDDDGETDTAYVTITAVDTSPPLLDCALTVFGIAADLSGGTTSPVATATDDCDPPPTIVNDRTAGGADATDFYPCGYTPVTFTATDAAGLTSTCTSLVVVVPAGSVGLVGPALRVRKSAVAEPVLDWSLVGPPGPEFRFAVKRSELADSGWSILPGADSLTGLTWVDATAPGDLYFYDVRSVVCDGILSAD